MRAWIVTVVVGVVVSSAELRAQTGLLHGAREQAAGFFGLMVEIFGEPIGPDDDWMVQDPVVDDFTDEEGQAATLNGINGNLVLIVGCNAGRLYGIGVGGLAGRRGPSVLFQNGDIQLRWGEGAIESRSWVDADRVLLIPDQSMPRFLRAATRQNRLRLRANVTRNRFIQDEFNLSRLTVSAGGIRMIDPAQGETERKELSCTR